MKRREFIKNSTLFLSCCAMLSGCKNDEIKENENQVIRRKFIHDSVPLIAFGGLMFYPMKDGKIDIPKFENMVKYAMQYGANYFATASMHINNVWENAIGDILRKYPRKNYILGNKIPVFAPNSKDDIDKIFNEQLKRCKVDYFDTYAISCLHKKNLKKYRQNDMYNQLMKLKKQGKIKYIGFSGPGDPRVFTELLNEHKWDFCQLKLNYLDWEEKDIHKLYEIADKAQIPIMATEPLRGNTLCELQDEIVNELKKECPGDSQASFALRWVASKKRVFSILCDMDDFKQLKVNIDTFVNYKEFSAKEEKIAHDIAEYIKSKNIIQCTACKYCLGFCPKEIKISDILTMYNTYKLSKLKNKDAIFVKKYNTLKDYMQGDKCIDCDLCSKNCPQGLDIPKLLKEAHNTVSQLEKKLKHS